MSQNQLPYEITEKLTYINAKCKNLEITLTNHKINIPKKSQKPDLYKLFYYLCKTNTFSIIPTDKANYDINDYISLHTTKKTPKKRKKDPTEHPHPHKTRKQQQDTNATDNDDMNDENYDNKQQPKINQPSNQEITEIISIDDDVYINNNNQEKLSLDENIFEINSQQESMSLDDDIYN